MNPIKEKGISLNFIGYCEIIQASKFVEKEPNLFPY
jgi:hypothetical protein